MAADIVVVFAFAMLGDGYELALVHGLSADNAYLLGIFWLHIVLGIHADSVWSRRGFAFGRCGLGHVDMCRCVGRLVSFVEGKLGLV